MNGGIWKGSVLRSVLGWGRRISSSSCRNWTGSGGAQGLTDGRVECGFLELERRDSLCLPLRSLTRGGCDVVTRHLAAG